jgi:Predicted carboxypeptidase
MRTITKYIILALICLSFTGLNAQTYTDLYFKAAGTPVNPKVAVSWNHYLTNAGIEKLCKEIAKAHPNLVKLESIGKSVGGIDLWVLTVTDFSKGDPKHKPAMWVDANIHGNELQGSDMALYIAWYLTESFNDNEFIHELMEQKVFYICPSMNPDGRAIYTEQAGYLRSGIRPLDNDRDGSIDEDDAQDLNGDGFITQMRKKNPNGRYIADLKYPNRMILAPEGVKGEYDLIGNEGMDKDGDGRANEDGIGGYDPNRDFGFSWQPNFIQSGALKYPFSLPESRAFGEFFMNHLNIAASQCFHNAGGMLLAPPGAELDQNKLNRSDIAVYEAIGKTGEQILPDYRYMVIYKDLYTVYGGALDWPVFARGVFTFSNELWSTQMMFRGKYNGEPGLEQYEFDKYLLFGDAFLEWKEYDHPVYGKIEIGGAKKNSPSRMHPGFLLEGDAHRNAAFVFLHAYSTPQLSISNVTEKNLSGGYKEITAEITNSRLMPTHSFYNIQNKIDRPDWVSISGPQVVAGMVMQNVLTNQGVEQKMNPSRISIENIPGNSTVTVRWIVKGDQKYTITVDSPKGGVVSR